MFVQSTTSSRKNGKTYVSYLVRQSFRTPEGSRSRTICNIIDLPTHTRELIAASLKGQDFLPAGQVHLHEALDYGGLAVLNDDWSRFHLDQLFADIGSPRQRGLLRAVIYSRLLFPCAKLSVAQKAQDTCWLKPAVWTPRSPSDEDDIYAAMDQFTGHWVGFEKQLYQRAFPQAVRLVLYDLTSVYFEGVAGDLDACQGATLRDIGHFRWKIENNAFGELTQHWHLTHCPRHHPVAVEALLWIKIIAFTLFHAFAMLHGKLLRLGKASLQEVRKQIYGSLLCGSPIRFFSG